MTNFAQETNTLYGNDGQGQFYDITLRAGLAECSYKPLGFGTNFFDYDNDGDLDLFVANGHVMDKITQVHPDHAYPQPNQVLCNQRGTRFVDVSARLGPALAVAVVSRASATADYDNDGDLDLLVTNVAAVPNLLRNDGGNRQHWLTIQLGEHRAARPRRRDRPVGSAESRSASRAVVILRVAILVSTLA